MALGEEKTNTTLTAMVLENLHIGYVQKKTAIGVCGPINHSFYKGQINTVIGLNGSGKTTLIKTLGGVLPTLGGDIYIDNKNLKAIKKEAISKAVSLVLTSPLASENMSVYDLVSMGRYPYINWLGKINNENHLAISKAIEFVGMEASTHKKVYELSDGQKQKAMVAKALAQDTPYIILDEPTSHLDLHHKAQLLKLLQRMSKVAHKTIIFSTHDIEMALSYSDAILVLAKDKIQHGSPKSLIEAGVFNELFPEDHISFNTQTATFSFKGLDTK